MEKKVYRGPSTSFGFKKPITVPTSNVKHSIPVSKAPPKSEESSLVIPPPARNGTPRLSRPMKETNGVNVRTNRFGFRSQTVLSNKVADLQNRTKPNLGNGLEEPLITKQIQAPRSHLPRMQQFPVRLIAPAHYHHSAEKSAKTAANNHTARRSRSENGGSSASSVNNDADSGVGSQKSGGELEIIEQLEFSPSARSRLRHPQKSRQMEMILIGQEKKFELRDLADSIEVTEIMPLELPPLPLNKRPIGPMREQQQSSLDSSDDEGIDDGPGEEKVHRDRVLSEKDERGVVGAGEDTADVDELWGTGEAMVEDMSVGQESDCEPGCKAVTPPLRSVLLSIEDHSFAALAAMSTSTMLEDESYPELPDFQNSLSLTCMSPNDSQPHQLEHKNSEEGSTGSPDTPTHTSNSLSLSSDNRNPNSDFIDDDYCDQPCIGYGNVTANSSGNTLVADEASPRGVKPLNSAVANLTLDCNSTRHSSVGTLSPCESLASDDLMIDIDLSAVEDDHRCFYRLETTSLDLGLTDAEGDEETEKALQDLSSLIAARPELMNGVRATRQLRPRVGSSGSGTNSPRSLDTPRLRTGSALSSSLRSSRQGTSSPGEDFSEDSGIRMHRDTYLSMYQDVINIKASLLKLSRVMQETDAENARETNQKNGLYSSSCESPADKSCEHHQDMISDLQRQVVFLRSQVEEKERTIRSLQTNHQPLEPRVGVETCNAATQTERVRPLSTGPILSTQPDSAGGSLVSSMTDSVKPHPSAVRTPVSRLPQLRRAPSPSQNELHKPLPLIGRRQT